MVGTTKMGLNFINFDELTVFFARCFAGACDSRPYICAKSILRTVLETEKLGNVCDSWRSSKTYCSEIFGQVYNEEQVLQTAAAKLRSLAITNDVNLAIDADFMNSLNLNVKWVSNNQEVVQKSLKHDLNLFRCLLSCAVYGSDAWSIIQLLTLLDFPGILHWIIRNAERQLQETSGQWNIVSALNMYLTTELAIDEDCNSVDSKRSTFPAVAIGKLIEVLTILNGIHQNDNGTSTKLIVANLSKITLNYLANVKPEFVLSSAERFITNQIAEIEQNFLVLQNVANIQNKTGLSWYNELHISTIALLDRLSCLELSDHIPLDVANIARAFGEPSPPQIELVSRDEIEAKTANISPRKKMALSGSTKILEPSKGTSNSTQIITNFSSSFSFIENFLNYMEQNKENIDPNGLLVIDSDSEKFQKDCDDGHSLRRYLSICRTNVTNGNSPPTIKSKCKAFQSAAGATHTINTQRMKIRKKAKSIIRNKFSQTLSVRRFC